METPRGVDRQIIIPGLTFFRNAGNGFSVLELHYTADPTKRSTAWRQRESIGIAKSDWDREYELSWVVRVGRAVYTDFSRSLHAFGPSTVRGDVEPPQDGRLVIGYDLGATASRLAATFNVLEKLPPRRWTIDEIYSEKSTIDEFLDGVEHLMTKWSHYKDPLHIVDPAAFESMSRIENRTCADVMKQHGLFPTPGEKSFVRRRRFVESALTEFRGGAPMYNAHERCTMTIEGFEGGYHYPKVPASRGGGYGAIPIKNSYSDVHDSIQYAFSASDFIFEETKPDENSWINSYVFNGFGGSAGPSVGALPKGVKIGTSIGVSTPIGSP